MIMIQNKNKIKHILIINVGRMLSCFEISTICGDEIWSLPVENQFVLTYLSCINNAHIWYFAVERE